MAQEWEHGPSKVLEKADQMNMEFHRENTYQGESSSTNLVIVDLTVNACVIRKEAAGLSGWKA